MKKEIIAIDGPAASGKSTVARMVAQQLDYKYIDSGAMYRCIALFLLEENIPLENVKEHLDDIKIDFSTDGRVLLNDKDVSEKIRSAKVTALVPAVAAIDFIRTKLVAMQQAYGVDKGIVMDGRDIGTVVFKDAKVKIFQVASVETRAMRRCEENLANNRDANYEEIKKEIERRDYEDINREVTPLLKADDAIELDSSNMSIEENVAAIIKIYEEKVR